MPDVRGQMVAGPLQNVSIAYRNRSYIADSVFRIIDGVDPKAKIARYLKGAWFRDEAGIRAPGTRANRGGFPTDYIDISTKEYAFASVVTDEDRRNAQSRMAPPLKPDQDAIELASDKIDLKKEKRVAELVKGTTWVDGNSGGEDAEGLWAAGTGNTFLADIAKGVKAIHNNSGFRPNCLLLDLGTFLSLKEEPTVLDKIKYTQRGVLTADLLAALLELEEVLIGEAFENTAKETKAGTSWTSSAIWEINSGKGMGFLFYRPANPGLKTPAAGYQARVFQSNGQVRRVMTWREEAEHQDVYEVAEETDIVVCGTDVGYLWKDTLLT